MDLYCFDHGAFCTTMVLDGKSKAMQPLVLNISLNSIASGQPLALDHGISYASTHPSATRLAPFI
jgi:hypothetical protein